MADSPEKLVYLQNGVFKRKEMTDGIQYYSDNSFDTFALPTDNGNYVLTKGDNGLLTWTEERAELTSIDNTFFKGSDGQALTVGTQGTIPFFKTNTTFGGIDLPSSGTYVLTTDGTTPSLEVFDAPLIFGTLGYDNTSNKYAIANWNSTASNHKDLVLPDKSGSFFLQVDSTSNNYDFATVNAKSLFHDTLGIASDTQRIVTYWGENAYGLEVPTTAGYATFKIENSNTSPLITNLTSTVIYQDILGCSSTERCLVYNDGSSVSKLDIPTDSGKYMLKVSDNALAFSLPDTKLNKTFDYSWTGSGHSVVSETLTSTDNTNLSEEITLSSDRQYLITIDVVLTCTNYEQALVGFTTTPNLSIGIRPNNIIVIPLNNPLPTIIASSSSVITPTTSGSLAFEVIRSGDTSIAHLYTRLHVTVVEL